MRWPPGTEPYRTQAGKVRRLSHPSYEDCAIAGNRQTGGFIVV